jgi:uncharacterized membrane protein
MIGKLRRAAAGSVLETSPHYRTAIGVLGMALPIVMMLSSPLLVPPGVRDSISAYYHTAMRDVFVGIVWVIGIFLFFYHYQPRQQVPPRLNIAIVREGAADAWLGKLSGICAIIVALSPTDKPGADTVAGHLHTGAACVLFICLALFPLLLFSQTRTHPRRYKVIGWAMLAVLAGGGLYGWASDGFDRIKNAKPLLIIETVLILLFAISWFIKGLELAKAARIEKRGGSPA